MKTLTYFHTANYEVTCQGPEITLRDRQTGAVQRLTGQDARDFETLAYGVPVAKLEAVLASYAQ
jgi:hypothetical protein